MNRRIEKILTTAACSLALLLLAGCATAKVTSQQSNLGANEMLPRPTTIWVYDFADTPDQVPQESALNGQETASQTPEEIQKGRELGAQIAMQLVEEINGMGLFALRADSGARPQVTDLVIRGYLLTVDEGSATKRVALGFGSGGSSLAVAVEGYQMTKKGLRKLGSGTVDAGGSKTPGAAVGAAAFIATANPVGLIVGTGAKLYGEHTGSAKVEGRARDTAKEIGEQLKTRFQRQGWIN